MSEQIMRSNLMVLAQAFADAKGWALSTVSKRIHGDQAFLERYISGKGSTTVKTYFTMVERFRAEWPTGAPWPKTVEVPKLSRTPHKALPERGDSGKFLGKKLDKGSRAPSR